MEKTPTTTQTIPLQQVPDVRKGVALSWLACFAFTYLIASLIFWLDPNPPPMAALPEDDFIGFLFTVLGAALVLFTIPAILIALCMFVRGLLKRSLSRSVSSRGILRSLFIVQSLIGMLAVAGHFGRQTTDRQGDPSESASIRTSGARSSQPLIDGKQLAPTKPFLFSPNFSDYSVTFSATPAISEMRVGAAEGLKAELKNPTTDSYQRAEVYPLAPGIYRFLTKELVFQDLRGYAERDGLSRPELEWGVGPLGPVASLRATKTVNYDGKQLRITHHVMQYYATNSVMCVLVGADTRNFPTQDILEFLKSVRPR